MSQDHCFNLGIVFVVFLPLLRIPNPKTVTENFSNGLQRHPLALRVKQDHENPTEEANSGIEPKSTTWGPTLHHGKESR